MEKTELSNGVYEAEITLYKTGNLHVKVKNRVTGKENNYEVTKKDKKVETKHSKKYIR